MMKTIVDGFNAIFPSFASTFFGGSCKVVEPANFGTSYFQEIELQGIDGYLFPHDLAQSASSLASISGHQGILSLDCDGIILFEWKGQKYILLCELKSTFDTQDIMHANEQLKGSSVKMLGMLNLVQGFNLNDYKVCGLIVSFEPTQEQLTAVSKLQTWDGVFSYRLQAAKYYAQPLSKCQKFHYPLNVQAIDLFYVPVPGRQVKYSVNLPMVLRLP